MTEYRTVELRCEDFPRRLFGKMLVEARAADAEVAVTDGLMEFDCRDCRKDYQEDGELVVRVLHRFDLIGNLVETVVVDSGNLKDAETAVPIPAS